MIYLDNSATSYYKPKCVIDAVSSYLKNPGNPGRGVNGASLSSGSIVYDTRDKISNFFNLNKASNVVFTSGVTESLNTIINGLIKPNDHVVTSYLEHNSCLRPLYNVGCDISFTDGGLNEIKQAVCNNTKAVILNHCSNVTGEVQDIKTVGEFCRSKGILFIVDAAQSAGILDINMQRDNIDILCFTGHKALLGMQGIGGILINTNIEIAPLKRGGTGIRSFDKEMPAQLPEHLEAGTINVPGIVSLNASIDYLKEYGLTKIYNQETNLRNKLLDYFSCKKGVTVYKNDKKNSIGIVSFNYKDIDAAWLSDYLSTEYNIAIRAGAHCAPLVLKHYGIDSCVRISIGINNTKKDIDTLISAFEKI